MNLCIRPPSLTGIQTGQFPISIIASQNDHHKEETSTANFASIPDSTVLSLEQKMIKESQEGSIALKSNTQDLKRPPEEEYRKQKFHLKPKASMPQLELSKRNFRISD